MLSLLRCCKMVLNLVHLLHKMVENVTPEETPKLISVNCITRCIK